MKGARWSGRGLFATAVSRRVFLVRHADAAKDKEDPLRGGHLTEIGRRQAEALARRAAGWQVDAILCSDKQRARETALAVHAYHPHAAFVIDPVFREVHRPGKTVAGGPGATLDGTGQANRELAEKVDAAWKMLLELPHQVTMVVTHEGLIKCLLGKAMSGGQSLKPDFRSANTGISALEIWPDRHKVTVHFFNDRSHLTPEVFTGGKQGSWIEDPVTGHWLFSGAQDRAGSDQLQEGQWVKIKGRTGPDGVFVAVQVAVKAGKDLVKLEGKIRSIDHRRNTLNVMNKEIRVPENIRVTGGTKTQVGLAHLREGQVVKIIGEYRGGLFRPERIKIGDAAGAMVMEEIQGAVDRISPESGTLETVGMRVALNDGTSIDARQPSRRSRSADPQHAAGR